MTYSRDFLTTANQSFQIAPLLPSVPVLDQDINLMQNAGFEQLRESLKARVPSGFLDMIESEPVADDATNLNIKNNLFTAGGHDAIFIKGAQRLVVDGMPVVLAHADTGLGLNALPNTPFSVVQMAALPAPTFQPANGVTSRKGSRVDMVILEVFRKEITTPASTSTADRRLAGLRDDGSFFPYGNTQIANNMSLTNDMIDPAVGGETSRRIQIQYRLRVVEDVNPHGSAHPMVAQATPAWPSHKRTSADGVAASSYNYAAVASDAGLYRAGDGSSGAKTALNTFDGYVYALPIAIVGRRNTGAFSMENLNGSTGRMDDKGANVHFTDIVDFRHNVKIDNNWDYKAIYEKNLNKILESNLRTTFEEWMMNSDGDNEFNASGIIGTKLTRIEGITGSAAPVNNAFQQTWQLQHNKFTQNGVSTVLDGLRNYFSDVGGDQAVTDLIPSIAADGTSTGHGFFSYVAATKTLELDATNLGSNDGIHASRTKISTRRPHLKWGAAMNVLGLTNQDVAGTWVGLGGDSASFTVSNETSFWFVSEVALTSIAIGDTYTSANGVLLTCTGVSLNQTMATFKWNSATLPTLVGNITRVTGSGPATLAFKINIDAGQAQIVVSEDISTLKTGAIYTGANAINYIVTSIFSVSGKSIQLTSQSYSWDTIPTGVYTKVSGDGPSTLTFVTDTPHAVGYSFTGHSKTNQPANIGLGSNVMPANAPILVNAYLTFAPGSGFMNRIPHQSNNSFIGCHFNVNGTQVLPNGGKGFIPFGSTVDPLNDGNLPVDSHSRTSNLMGFVYKNPVMGNYYTNISSVLKEGGVYYGFLNYEIESIQLVTSSDGLSFINPQTLLSKGADPLGNDVDGVYSPCVIKDGATYHMWYIGCKTSPSFAASILHSTSTDRVTWTTPVKVADIRDRFSYYWARASVIKDGATFKMWASNFSSDTSELHYMESSDGISWSTPQVLFSTTHPQINFLASVIKEGNIYKMFHDINSDPVWHIGYRISADGKNWSNSQHLIAHNITPFPSDRSAHSCVIKDGVTYKIWFTQTGGFPYFRCHHAVLTMTDTANTGSSLTGVYPTTGSLNHAPPTNSQVVVFYEAVADQCDRALAGTFTGTTTYVRDWIASNLGTNHTAVPTAKWRDFIATIQPKYYSVKPYIHNTDKVASSIGLSDLESCYTGFTNYYPSYVRDYIALVPAYAVSSEASWLAPQSVNEVGIIDIMQDSVEVINSAGVCITVASMTGVNQIPSVMPAGMNSLKLYSHRIIRVGPYVRSIVTSGDAIGGWANNGHKMLNPLGRPILK